ncbi:putative serine/threonine-protein kinase [Trichinella spiralis]|uniref:Serine/threonine-protein kinase n=1 Tax=Trichinella spiralis TaxID=6334 RepID=A0ABR3K229_TRISP
MHTQFEDLKCPACLDGKHIRTLAQLTWGILFSVSRCKANLTDIIDFGSGRLRKWILIIIIIIIIIISSSSINAVVVIVIRHLSCHLASNALQSSCQRFRRKGRKN